MVIYLKKLLVMLTSKLINHHDLLISFHYFSVIPSHFWYWKSIMFTSNITAMSVPNAPSILATLSSNLKYCTNFSPIMFTDLLFCSVLRIVRLIFKKSKNIMIFAICKVIRSFLDGEWKNDKERKDEKFRHNLIVYKWE